MSIPALIFFYTVPASLIFLYGIGLERLSMNARSNRVVFPFILKTGVLMLASASITRLVLVYILAPAGLNFLMPIVSLVIVYLCDTVLYRIFPQEKQHRIRERLFACGTVIFALFHAFTYIELLVIILSAAFGMVIWSLVLSAVKCRVDESQVSTQWKNAPLLLISMGMIALALYAWDSAWIISICNFK